MAQRPFWSGYLKLSLVSCPISLYPATSEREKISFHQLNRETGNRIRYKKVDAETGDEVENADIVKGYEVDKGEYIELAPDGFTSNLTNLVGRSPGGLGDGEIPWTKSCVASASLRSSSSFSAAC